MFGESGRMLGGRLSRVLVKKIKVFLPSGGWDRVLIFVLLGVFWGGLKLMLEKWVAVRGGCWCVH